MKMGSVNSAVVTWFRLSTATVGSAASYAGLAFPLKPKRPFVTSEMVFATPIHRLVRSPLLLRNLPPDCLQFSVAFDRCRSCGEVLDTLLAQSETSVYCVTSEDEEDEDEDSEDEDSEDEDSEDEDSEQESNDDDADRGGRQCQTCHRNLAPPFFGKGRFCDSKCAGRFSRSPATKTQTYGSSHRLVRTPRARGLASVSSHSLSTPSYAQVRTAVFQSASASRQNLLLQAQRSKGFQVMRDRE